MVRGEHGTGFQGQNLRVHQIKKKKIYDEQMSRILNTRLLLTDFSFCLRPIPLTRHGTVINPWIFMLILSFKKIFYSNSISLCFSRISLILTS